MSIKHPSLIQCRWIAAVGIAVFASLLFSITSHAMTKDEAVAKVQSDHDGKVLDIQRVSVHNKETYRIKLLRPKGRVEVLLIDTESGEALPKAKDQ